MNAIMAWYDPGTWVSTSSTESPQDLLHAARGGGRELALSAKTSGAVPPPSPSYRRMANTLGWGSDPSIGKASGFWGNFLVRCVLRIYVHDGNDGFGGLEARVPMRTICRRRAGVSSSVSNMCMRFVPVRSVSKNVARGALDFANVAGPLLPSATSISP